MDLTGRDWAALDLLVGMRHTKQGKGGSYLGYTERVASTHWRGYEKGLKWGVDMGWVIGLY